MDLQKFGVSHFRSIEAEWMNEWMNNVIKQTDKQPKG